MKLEDLIKALSEKGLTDEEIKKALEELKAEIEMKLGEGKEEEDKAEEPKEDEAEKQKRIFGVDY